MTHRLHVTTIPLAELRFTDREWAVVEALLQDTGTTKIAEKLGISVHTARRHIERVMMKLRISSRHDVRQALGIRCDCARVQVDVLRRQAASLKEEYELDPR
jgi:DNA-binding NarL/FixJ family response regulator